MILCTSRVSDMIEEEYNVWFHRMSMEKQQRAGKMRFPDDRKRMVAAEKLAREMISGWCGFAPEKIIFASEEYGKPYAVGLNVCFNVSHSGDMVVCAVSDNPVGIDVEQIRPVDLSMAKRFCSEEELRYLFGGQRDRNDFSPQVTAERLHRFFEIWTSKEAFCKFTGRGLDELRSIPSFMSLRSERFVMKRLMDYQICCVTTDVN